MGHDEETHMRLWARSIYFAEKIALMFTKEELYDLCQIMQFGAELTPDFADRLLEVFIRQYPDYAKGKLKNHDYNA